MYAMSFDASTPSTLRAALQLAADQDGAVAVEQLTALGVTRWQLARAVERGVLRPAFPRVYAVVGAPRGIRMTQRIGLLALGEGSVLSHEAAARLHGFDRHLDGMVEFTVVRAHRGVRLDVVVHTTRSLPTIDRVRVDGFPVTSATRTIIDLARQRVPELRLEAAIDSAVRNHQTAPSVLASRLADLRGPGRWGVRLLDRLLLDSGGHSPIERDFLGLVRDAGLPQPTPQVIFHDGARTLARVDFLFRASALVVEVAGRRGHSSDLERERDAQRRNELQAMGLRVVEFTTRDLARRRPYVVATVRRHCADTSGPSPAA